VAAGQVTQPVRAAGGAAAIPLTRVVYAATSLTFQRAALPGWPTCCAGAAIENGVHYSYRGDVIFGEDASPAAPALPRRSWQPCATWPSACSAEQDRSMPPRSGSTAATPTDPWRPSGSASDETDITQERQSPGIKPDDGAYAAIQSTQAACAHSRGR
jgi:hypothetical protein